MKPFFKILLSDKKTLATILLSVIAYGIFSSLALWSVSPLFSVLFGKENLLTEQTSIFNFNPKNLIAFLIEPSKSEGLFFRVSLLIISLFGLRNLFAFTSNFSLSLLQEKTSLKLRKQLFETLLQNPLSYFEAVSTGENISKITQDIERLMATVFQNFVILLKEPILVLAYFSVVLWISPKLTFLTFAVCGVSLVFIRFLTKTLKSQGKLGQEIFARITEIAKETFDGILLLKTFRSEKFFFSKFEKELQNYFKVRGKVISRQSLASPLSEFLGILALTFVLILGSEEVLVEKTISPDDFVVFLLGLFQLMSPLKKLSNANAFLQEGKGIAERIFTEVEQEAVKTKSPKFEKEIRFEKVNFTYPNGTKVFEDFDFSLQKGETKIFTGENGFGKTTLVKLMLGLLKSNSGKILVDGVSVEKFELGTYLELFAFVPQEVRLFDFTLAENLTFGKEINYAKVEKIFAILGLDKVLEKLPKDLETKGGELGNKFSGGERQKFAIARGLLREAEILVLDEPTTYLDEKTVESLLEFLRIENWFSTILVISHNEKFKEFS
ncbi:MAG: ABC transporter ATP-binding protein [Calditrichaeota bacterium]|nr:MAG: ABC transporter ATP-binding protein [Calditrichota bacterium]